MGRSTPEAEGLAESLGHIRVQHLERLGSHEGRLDLGSGVDLGTGLVVDPGNRTAALEDTEAEDRGIDSDSEVVEVVVDSVELGAQTVNQISICVT